MADCPCCTRIVSARIVTVGGISVRMPNCKTTMSRSAGRANTMGQRFGKTNCGTTHLKPATTAAETTTVASVIRTSDTGLMMWFSCDHNCRVYAQRGTYHVSLGFAVASLLLRYLICPQNDCDHPVAASDALKSENEPPQLGVHRFVRAYWVSLNP